MESTENDIQGEKVVMQKVIMNLQNYTQMMKRHVNRMKHNFDVLSDQHKKFLAHRKNLHDEIESLTYHNQQILNIIIEFGSEFGHEMISDPQIIKRNTDQFDRVKTTLKQIVRDWSNIGEEERETSYRPILDIINSEFPDPESTDRKNIRILTPGCGLGRLTWELYAHGFYSEGCEFSWYMILASRFILEQCREIDTKFRLFPFIHETNNLRSWTDATKEATFPDVDLDALPVIGGSMHMGIGDFLELYTQESWSCVATVFFIDTARNIIDYVEKIFNILLPGGLWVNNGPLLYHFAGSKENSIELSWEELKNIILQVGFTLEIEDRENCQYVQNPQNMMKNNFETILFTARKPI